MEVYKDELKERTKKEINEFITAYLYQKDFEKEEETNSFARMYYHEGVIIRVYKPKNEDRMWEVECLCKLETSRIIKWLGHRKGHQIQKHLEGIINDCYSIYQMRVELQKIGIDLEIGAIKK